MDSAGNNHCEVSKTQKHKYHMFFFSHLRVLVLNLFMCVLSLEYIRSHNSLKSVREHGNFQGKEDIIQVYVEGLTTEEQEGLDGVV